MHLRTASFSRTPDRVFLPLQVTSVGTKQREYTEAIDKANRWLKDTEGKVAKLLAEPVGKSSCRIMKFCMTFL